MDIDAVVSERRKLVWCGGTPTLASRSVAEEKAIALSYCGSTHAVMMATPGDLEDFGMGFSITEGIVERAEQISSIEVIESELGIEVRMWVDADRQKHLVSRRRAIAGPVGCGLCGIESLEQACPAPHRVNSEQTFPARDLLNAVRALPPLQRLNQETRAVHAAG